MSLQIFTKFLTISTGFYEQTTTIRHFIYFKTHASALYGTYINISIVWVCKEGGNACPIFFFYLRIIFWVLGSRGASKYL
jgi:hypothetical protein